MVKILTEINNIVWGRGLVLLILLTGVIYTIKFRFIQFRMPSYILSGKKTENSGLSQFRTVCMSLGTTMGTGNITGTAAALATGGAGAIFWLWVSAFLGMAVVYAENELSVKYSNEDVKGSFAYIAEGVGSRKLALIFAVFCVLASVGMGGMVQVNTVSVNLQEWCGVSPLLLSAAAFIVIFAITSGGAERIGAAAQFLLPFASLAYFLISIVVIIVCRENICSVFADIFRSAFNFKSVSGGFAGYAVSVGVRRGIFSNEAGLGSSPILHSTAGETEEGAQGMWSMFEVFFDTILCCTLTAVTLLCSSPGFSVNESFAVVLGNSAAPFVTAELAIFALCTVIGWYYCGSVAFSYIVGKNEKIFCFIFAAVAASGASFSAAPVWILSDIFNGLMAFPNIFALLYLVRCPVRNG